MTENFNIIALESAGSNCSVALFVNGALFSEYNIFEKNLHDKYLADLTNRIIHDAGIKITDINAVAVSAGPGSFTGLRISGSIAKGLTFDDKIKLISVPTLKAIAKYAASRLGKFQFEKIIATVKAHKDLLYYQVFSNSGQELSEITFCTLEEFNQLNFENAFLCGSAANEFPDYSSIEDFNQLSAKFIGQLACQMYEDNMFVKSEDYTPLYIQEFQPKNKPE